MIDIDGLTFAPARDGMPPLIPVVAQDGATGEVLMVGWADRDAIERTVRDRRLWLYSRSRRRLWMKGETSGNVLQVGGLAADCDGDVLLARVRPLGPTCHTGARSCFPAPPTLAALADVIEQRRAHPEAHAGGYTARLLGDRNLRLKKLGEEATELALACADADSRTDDHASARDRVTDEAADLLYHAFVACAAAGVPAADVLERLAERLPPPTSASTSSDRTDATARARETSTSN